MSTFWALALTCVLLLGAAGTNLPRALRGEPSSGLGKGVASTPIGQESLPKGVGNIPPEASPDYPAEHINVGTTPVGVAVDSINGDAYVANEGSNNVSAINVSTGQVIKSIPVGNTPYDIAIYPANGDVYVTNSGGDNLSVINPVTNAVVTTIPVGIQPQGIAYDPDNHMVYVANFASENVTVINPATNAPVGSILIDNGTYKLSDGPRGVAIDTLANFVYITEGGPFSPYPTDGIYQISGLSDAVTGFVADAYSPESIAYGALCDCLYVANTDASPSNLTIIQSPLLAENGSISLAWNDVPLDVVEDGFNGILYVTGSVSGSLLSYDAQTQELVGTTPVGRTPAGIAIDPSNGYVLVSNSGSNNISVIDGGLPLYPVEFAEQGLPEGNGWWINLSGRPSQFSSGAEILCWLPNGSYMYTASAANKSYAAKGDLFDVAGSMVGLSISFELVTYPATYVEAGLPPLTEWWLTIIGRLQINSTNKSISISLPNGSYFYSVGSVNRSYAAEGGALTVAGSSAFESVTFTRVTFSVTFVESGLPPGGEWWANVTGQAAQNSTTTVAAVLLPNGSYNYEASTNEKNWSTVATGIFVVSGEAVSVAITFVAQTYAVVFRESGLPGGTEWWSNVTGEPSQNTTGNTIMVALQNGTYSYLVATADTRWVPTAGMMTAKVAGSTVPISVTFAALTYAVTFSESGLPRGVEWWSNVTGEPSKNATGSMITVMLQNGTYDYAVATGDKRWAPMTPKASVRISGTGERVAVAFAVQTYAVTFTETGLGAGVNWSATLGGTLQSSTAGAIAFALINGSYSYDVSVPAGYTTVNAREGTVTVQGIPVSLTIPYTANAASPPAPATILSLPPTTFAIMVGSTAVVAAAFIILRARRKP